MTNVTYGITEEKYILDDVFRTSYGIAAYENSKTNGTASIVAYIHDISDNKERLLKLVQACNRLELSTTHLYDVVEDFLAD